jgi:hypothetical protein
LLILLLTVRFICVSPASAQTLSDKDQRILHDLSSIDLMLISLSTKPTWRIVSIHPLIENDYTKKISDQGSLYAYSTMGNIRKGFIKGVDSSTNLPSDIINYRFDSTISPAALGLDGPIGDPFLTGGVVLMPLTDSSQAPTPPFPVYCIKSEWASDLEDAIDYMRKVQNELESAGPIDSQDRCLQLLNSTNIFLQNFAVQRLGALLSGDSTGIWSATSIGTPSGSGYESDPGAPCLPGAIKNALINCIVRQQDFKQALLLNTLISTMTQTSIGEIEDIIETIIRRSGHIEEVSGCLLALNYTNIRPLPSCPRFDPASYIALIQKKPTEPKEAHNPHISKPG